MTTTRTETATTVLHVAQAVIRQDGNCGSGSTLYYIYDAMDAYWSVLAVSSLPTERELLFGENHRTRTPVAVLFDPATVKRVGF